ncbi:hypothetical protein B0T26DRAFT_768300 [Lasiosphaeria miniovina]|uniref:Hsp70 family chaperone n=1 Tax=Lasiosphaeria miniovina TaxID=1954250 RepID=A0AA40B790_9PEZI|nr:uncharacterized protein B0T26DRAFT_768300 [Lasiosphaeria miniovina]KAK0728618.1 hypothetical protein B0T26DRAFT_768300 [Lasiosphaeria miniovina]
MVIGIDFGTTFSGAVWATAADLKSNQVNLITDWPGTDEEDAKAPTELFYEDDKVLWGYEIPADADPIRWFKLLLLKDEDLHKNLKSSELLLRARRMLRENGKTAIDLISDYLRLLWQHILESIHKVYGEPVVDAMPFHVVLTVPAIWKNYARQGMQRAAKAAGILDHRPAGPTKLSFAPEPEAAAMSTFCEPNCRAKPGEVYVICDAGGGTVDLISYKIDRVDPVAMKEAVVGTGGLYGAIFVDEAFESICKARLGRSWDHLSKAGIKEIMKGDWEQIIKARFKPGNANKEYIIRIPVEAFANSSQDDTSRKPFIKYGCIHFGSDDIQKAFAQVFEGIKRLITAQINEVKSQRLTVSKIILVGGLGSSPYLYECLKQKYARSNITVVQPGGIRPRAAICIGAVIKGFLEDRGREDRGGEDRANALIRVSSTISRENIGVVSNWPFDPEVHDIRDKFFDNRENEWKAKGQMDWFIKRGDNVATNEPVSHSFYQLFGRSEYTRKFTRELYQCGNQEPPSRFGPQMKKLCKITVNLNVDYSQLEDFTNPVTGQRLEILMYNLELRSSEASAEFAVVVNGNRLGAKNVDMAFL